MGLHVHLPGRPWAMVRAAAASIAAMLLGGCAHLPDVAVPDAPVGAGVVVFDIDGTLTPDVARIFSARPEAAAAVARYASQGHRILYLTARAPALQGNLRRFLARGGFPPGDLVAPHSRAEHAQPAAFKARVLAGYRQHGWTFVAAYGDSSTDFEAYARAGIPSTRVFALRRMGATACQPGAWSACLPGWSGARRE